GVNRLRQILGAMAAVALLLLVAGCGTAGMVEETAGPSTPAATGVAGLPSPTDAPTTTPTSSPSPTLAPTLPPPAATRTPLPGTAPEGAVLATIEAIESEVEDMRGLEETSPMTRTLLTRDELSLYLEQQFEDDYPPEEVAVDTRVLAAFNFVSESIDLRQVLLDLYSSQVLGMYEDEIDTFFIVNDDEFDLMDRLTLAHEYVHGLQDETFGLDAFVDEDTLDDDQYLARLALVEGDATVAMTDYFMAHVAELSQAELNSLREVDPESQAALEAAPAIIRETTNFPYDYGAAFVMALQEQGWDAVDAAYARPPQSTEQILHPERYLGNDEPQLVSLPPLTDTLGAGWSLVDAETLGEFQTILYLAQQVDRDVAEAASAGWDGDAYAVYGRDEDDVLVLATVWDSPAEAEEFVAAYRTYVTRHYDQGPVRVEKEEIWWRTPEQVTVLSWQADRTFIVVGPNLAPVERVLADLVS
ncbi:MAG: hypothetical protein P8129_20440, partial [Anaerolineae bacterium]